MSSITKYTEQDFVKAWRKQMNKVKREAEELELVQGILNNLYVFQCPSGAPVTLLGKPCVLTTKSDMVLKVFCRIGIHGGGRYYDTLKTKNLCVVEISPDNPVLKLIERGQTVDDPLTLAKVRKCISEGNTGLAGGYPGRVPRKIHIVWKWMQRPWKQHVIRKVCCEKTRAVPQ